MSLNLQPGQTWRNRAGAFVTVEYKASQRSWYLRHESDHKLTGYLVDAKGQPAMRSNTDELALMERAERVYVSAAWVDRIADTAREHYRKRGCLVTGTSAEGPQQSLRELIECETLVLLEGWEMGKFSRVENAIAQALDMNIVYPQEY